MKLNMVHQCIGDIPHLPAGNSTSGPRNFTIRVDGTRLTPAFPDRGQRGVWFHFPAIYRGRGKAVTLLDYYYTYYDIHVFATM